MLNPGMYKHDTPPLILPLDMFPILAGVAAGLCLAPSAYTRCTIYKCLS